MSLTNVTFSEEARQKNEYCIFNLQVQKQFKWQLSKVHWWLPLGESDLVPLGRQKLLEFQTCSIYILIWAMIHGYEYV